MPDGQSGTDIPIATNVSSGTQYMVGDPSVGTLATLGLGTGFAVDDRADILATSMARSGNASNAEFTPEADKLLGQAVGYVANRPPDIDLTTIKYPDSSAQLNESIELTVNISNTGGSSAISAANLLINGTPDADQVLELSPGDKVSIPFSTKATLDMIPSVTVEAGYAGVQSYRNVVSVYPPTLDRINLTLANNSILRGGYTFSNVIATYETGYSPAVDEHVDTWSANTSVATIANGTVIGEGAGSTRIFAEFDDGTNSDIDYTTVTVTEAPKKSLLLISSTSLFVDQTRTPRAFLTYETPIIDNVTDKVTFSSNNSSVLSVNDNIITGMSPGQANLTATLDANQSINTTKTFTVSEPDLLYLDVVLGSASLRAPETTSAQVIGNYQAGITRDVTANATILSFNETVATVNGSTVRSKAAGETEIYAEFDGQFNTSVVNVTEPDVQSLALEAPASMVINDTGPVTVNATDSQGTVSNVSQNATITSSNTSVITVDNTTLEAVGAGNATITASYAGTSATATVAVTPVGPPTYEMSIPNDGGIYSLGFPAAINGSLAAAFPNGYDGLSAVYRYDNGWTQINDFANTSVDPLDTIVLTTRGNAGPAEVDLAVPLQTGSSLSTRSVSAGWQYIAAPAFTDAESAFGGSIDPSVTIIDRYGGPSSSEFQSVSPFAFYQFGSYQWGVTPPAVSPFKGYFVYFQNSATVPVVVSDLESKSDADFRLGVESGPTASLQFERRPDGQVI
ncbi:MAG: hypothetical protein U5K37_08895 [Natrialbaceae archaeon]|nr:hypothetical protein [Natrialbaceae archaeon]